MHEAKSQLSRLVEMARNGEEVILARDGEPVARIVRMEPVQKGPRQLGMARGVFRAAPDFNDPMTEQELDEFLGL